MARAARSILAAALLIAGSLAEPSADGAALLEEAAPACLPSTETAECVGKAACFQLRLEAEALQLKDLSLALEDLLAIDRLARKSHGNGTEEQDAERRAGLEAELKQLEQRVHDREVNSTVDTEAIISHLKSDIRALNAWEERTLYDEARKVGEAARRSARDLQAAVRHSARKARTLSDKMERAGHERRRCSDMADTLSRRVESATDHAERKGEVLARRIDDAVELHLRHAEAGLQGGGHPAALKASAEHAGAAPTRLFLQRPEGLPVANGHALLAVALFCTCVSAAVIVAKRRWPGADSVSPPDSLLG